MPSTRSEEIRALAAAGAKLLEPYEVEPIGQDPGHQMGYLCGTLHGIAEGFITCGQVGLSRAVDALGLRDHAEFAETITDLEALGATSAGREFQEATPSAARDEERRIAAAEYSRYIRHSFVDATDGFLYVKAVCHILDRIDDEETTVGQPKLVEFLGSLLAKNGGAQVGGARRASYAKLFDTTTHIASFGLCAAGQPLFPSRPSVALQS